MAISSLSGINPAAAFQAINRDADNAQQRQVTERPRADNQENRQSQTSAQTAMTSGQANAQEAARRAQATRESQTVDNNQAGNNASQAASGLPDGKTRGALIDLLA